MRLFLLVGTLLVLLTGCVHDSVSGVARSREYQAAFFDGSVIRVFSERQRVSDLLLPLPLTHMAFSTDGKTIYGLALRTDHEPARLVAFVLGNGALLELTHLPGFGRINSVVVSSDFRRALIAGIFEDSEGHNCGVYEMEFSSSRVRRVFASDDSTCDYLTSWTNLNYSSDGTRMVGTVRKGEVALANVTQNQIIRRWKATDGYLSPDGKWIAIVGFATPMTVEIAALDGLGRSSTIDMGGEGSGSLAWSPDSRYLLALRQDWKCILGWGYWGTLSEFELRTGQWTTINGSSCGVNRTSFGWVISN